MGCLKIFLIAVSAVLNLNKRIVTSRAKAYTAWKDDFCAQSVVKIKMKPKPNMYSLSESKLRIEMRIVLTIRSFMFSMGFLTAISIKLTKLIKGTP